MIINNNQSLFHNVVENYKVQSINSIKNYSRGNNNQTLSSKSKVEIEDTSEVSDMARLLFDSENNKNNDTKLVAMLKEYASKKQNSTDVVTEENSNKAENAMSKVNNILLSKLRAYKQQENSLNQDKLYA